MEYGIAALCRRFLCWSFCVGLLAGCAYIPSWESRQDREAMARRQAEVEAAAAAEAERRAKREQIQARQTQRIDSLLSEAAAALADNRLTTPLHDNAYDRYRAVLLLQPDNRVAQTGLESVLLHYVDLVREALRDNQVSQAQQLLARSREYFPGNPLLEEVRAAVDQAQQKSRQRLQRLNEQDLVGAEFVLPPVELAKKSPEIIQFLAKIAERLRETDESVLIMARTDAEARWIYKQMKEAVPDYRIRGNVRLTSDPALQLLPPL
jgi:exopolysaccharide biosynthesis predicted pyruvyltransferase EpsI